MGHSPVPVFAKSGTEIHRIPHKKKTIAKELPAQSSVFEKKNRAAKSDLRDDVRYVELFSGSLP